MSKKLFCKRPANAALAVCQVLGGSPKTGEGKATQAPAAPRQWGKWAYRATLAAVAAIAVSSALASQPQATSEADREDGYTNIGTAAAPLYRTLDLELGVACYRNTLNRHDAGGTMACVHVPAGN